MSPIQAVVRTYVRSYVDTFVRTDEGAACATKQVTLAAMIATAQHENARRAADGKKIA